jgi:hypothetical protein
VADCRPLPYGTAPARVGAAPVQPLAAPELTVVDVRRDGDGTVLDVHAVSPRAADVLVLHAARRVTEAMIAAEGRAAVVSRPSYTESADGAEWPYELRFYDVPAEGFGSRCDLPASSRRA